MKWDENAIAQIQLPAPGDDDERPRLLLNGEGLHAGDCFTALMPSGWEDIRLEVSRNKIGAASWYVATEGYRHICPVGLFVRLENE